MKCSRLILSLACLVALAAPLRGDLTAQEWKELRLDWNRMFRMDPPGDLMRNIMRGNFPDKVEEIASLQGAAGMKMLEETVKEIEAYLKEKAKGKLKALEGLRNADDPRALKLLATTVKLAMGDFVVLMKVEKELKKKLEKVKKSLTKTDKGVTGSSEAIFENSRLKACIELLPPFVTHSINVKRAALLGFTGARSDKAIKWILNEGLKDKDWEVRTGVVEALAEIEHPDGVKALEKALNDRDPAVRTTALSSLVARDARGSKHAFLICLGDKSWEVRVGVLEAIEELEFRDVETIDALIEAMQKEEGRLCDDFDHILNVITGKSYYGDPALWKRWWEDNREKFVAREKGAGGDERGPEPAPPPPPPPAHKGPGATTSFYGIQTKSHKIIYVLDVSGSMAEKANLESLPAGGKGPVVTGKGHRGPDPDPGDRPQGDTKLDVLKWQLKRTIRMLPHKATFNVLFYNDKFEVWSEKMVLATPANKKKVFAYIDKQTAQGRTNIFDPLEKAFSIATSGQKAGGAGDPRYASSMGGADTFYLLSDGSPNAGRIPDQGGILAEIRKINKLRKVVIHTVAVGGAYNPHFMKRLAEENGGKCVIVK